MTLLVVCLAAVNMLVGSVHIPAADVFGILLGDDSAKESWQYIVIQSRLPQAVAAILCGAALAVSGLMLQTAFKNPLAGPSIFGISNGAGLGVALVMLLMGGQLQTSVFSASGFMAILLAAFIGAMVVTAIIFFFSTMVRNHVMLLIIGIMIGYLASSAISLLNFFATEEGVKSFMVWGMGNFGGVSMTHLPVFTIVTLLGLAMALLLTKPLNALLLGERYAENLGVNTRRTRNLLLLATGLLTAITTAFCGPTAPAGHHAHGGCRGPPLQCALLSARRTWHHTAQCHHPARRRTCHHLCHTPTTIISLYFLQPLCISVVPMWPVATDRSNRFAVSVDGGVGEYRTKGWGDHHHGCDEQVFPENQHARGAVAILEYRTWYRTGRGDTG